MQRSLARTPRFWSLTLVVALSACSKKEEPTPADAAPAAESPSEATPTVEVPTPPTAVTPVEIPAASPVDYPVALDAALDLVPADAETFVVVRDPHRMRGMAKGAIELLADPARSIAKRLPRAVDDTDPVADLERFFADYAAFDRAVDESGIELDKGLLVYGSPGGETVVVVAAEDPKPVVALGKAVGAGDAVHCTKTKSPGWVACGAGAEVEAYEPGAAAAAQREKLRAALPGVDLERANAIARIDADGTSVAVALETTPRTVHASLGIGAVAQPLGDFFASGPASALGLVAPGSGFVWLRVDPAAIAARLEDAPFVAKNILGTATGEAMFGLLDEPLAAALLVGVSDPAPASGLVAMAGTQLGEIPKRLPDGGKVDAATKSVSVGDAPVQAIHVRVEGSGQAKAAERALGLRPEAFFFAAGSFAAATWGADESVVKAIAGAEPTGPSQALIDDLVPPLARALSEQRAAFVFHMSLDGLHAPVTRASIETLMKQAPQGAESPVDPEVVGEVFGLLAALSSVSLWIEEPASVVVHVAAQTFGDDSEAGRAAAAAMRSVMGGADPAATYGPLADAHPQGRLGRALAVRAGRRPDGALMSVAMVGVAAAVAIPAFMKYIERSKAAAGQ